MKDAPLWKEGSEVRATPEEIFIASLALLTALPLDALFFFFIPTNPAQCVPSLILSLAL